MDAYVAMHEMWQLFMTINPSDKLKKKHMVFEYQSLKPYQYHIPLVKVKKSQSKNCFLHPIRHNDGYVALHSISLCVQLHLAITRLRIPPCRQQAQSFKLLSNVSIH